MLLQANLVTFVDTSYCYLVCVYLNEFITLYCCNLSTHIQIAKEIQALVLYFYIYMYVLYVKLFATLQ